MNLLKKTREICDLYKIKPTRSKGQNFLIKEEIYDEIVRAAEITKDDFVLEVGPGLGFLTAKLSKAAKKVVAVELDDKLAEFLRMATEAEKVGNVEIINMNVLDFNPFSIEDKKYKIVANLPYNITSVFLRKFLSETENKPETMVLMLQKEVAERICATPGDMSLLTISVQFYAYAEIVQYVPRNDFWPSPEVDSAVIKLTVHKASKVHKDKERDFFRLVKFGFSAKRKMLKNNLASGFHISQKEAEEKIVLAGFNPKCRAEDLGVEDWKKLFGKFYL